MKEQEKEFMSSLMQKFTQFVNDSMDQGVHKDFNDHYDFLAASLETFKDLNEDPFWSPIYNESMIKQIKK
jgi:hypothetical protein